MRRHRLVLAALLFLAAVLLGAAPGYGQEAARQPTTCRIGINIEDIYDIDIARDTFGAELWLWSLCPTDAVDPLATVTFPTATSVNLGELASVPTGGNGYYRYSRVQGTFRHDWNMKRYPFDRHRVVIPLDETHLGADDRPVRGRHSRLVPHPRHPARPSGVADLRLRHRRERQRGGADLRPAQPAEARYARLEVSFTLTRIGFLTFLKLSAGVFAAGFIALMSFFYDGRDPKGLTSRLGLLVGTLFAVLVNLRTADTVIGDMGRMTLVTEIHLLALLLIVVLAVLALRDWWRAEGALPWPIPTGPSSGSPASCSSWPRPA